MSGYWSPESGSSMKTPQQSYEELNKALGVEVYLKREDLHKYGSHKGRSSPLMIKKYFKENGITNFVISSSGNAALAAIHAIQAHNRNNSSPLSLCILVGQHIEPQKLKLLNTTKEDHRVTIEQVHRPIQKALQMEKDNNIKYLRQSTDDIALLGYGELAEELNKISNLSAIFIPTSSGTTAQALGGSFHAYGQKPQIHIVQTTACHPIAEHFDRNIPITESSIARAIVDKAARRKEKVIEEITQSHGSGWIVTDSQIQDAIKLIKTTCSLAISPNSALSIAGLKKAVDAGHAFNGVVVCLITGR